MFFDVFKNFRLVFGDFRKVKTEFRKIPHFCAKFPCIFVSRKREINQNLKIKNLQENLFNFKLKKIKKMKKLIFASALLFSAATFSAFTSKNTSKDISVEVTKRPNGEICFKIKNDTGASVTLHTGSGTAPMPSGSLKEFCIAEGKKLSLSEKGQPGKMLVKVSADLAGKKIDLSSLM